MGSRLPLVAAAATALLAAGLVGVSSSATAGGSGSACAGTLGNGYVYAGHQATHRGHGVRATVTALREPRVAAGHVAGWVGVGGPGQGRNGEDAWMQAGLASVPGIGLFSYVEITRPGRTPELRIVADGLAAGTSHRFAVLELGRRPGWWRAWIDGRAVTEPVRLRGSTGRWAPIATAESWNGGAEGCNRFAFRFERVSVSYGGGGSWRPFVPAHRFLDTGNALRRLAAAPAANGVYSRTLASAAGPLPYAFVASSR